MVKAKAAIIAVALIFVLGCDYKKVLVLKAADKGVPAAEKKVGEFVEAFVSEEISKSQIGKNLEDMRKTMPLVYDSLKSNFGKFPDFFEKKLTESFQIFKESVNKVLKKHGKTLSDFDYNKDGRIAFNEYLHLYYNIKDDKDSSWRKPGSMYLTWQYLYLLFVKPSSNAVSSYLKE